MENNATYQRKRKEFEDHPIILLDERGNVERPNKGTQKIRGYKTDEIIGKNIRVFYTTEDQENGLPEKLINDATINGKATYKGWSIRKNGARFWSNIVITALYNKIGDLTGFTKVTSELTVKKHSGTPDESNPDIIHNDEFDQNNLYALINNTSDLMWSVDVNYKLITSNSSFGETVRRMTGKSISKGSDVLANGYVGGQSALYRKLYERAFSGETFKVTEYTGTPVEFWSELSFYPICNGDEVVGTACYAHDVTARKKSENELIIANKELVFQNEEKEKRAAEKETRAEELIIANKELAFQNEEKEKRAAELIIANKELVFQNEEKEKRAAELIIANKELVFQNEEKEKRAGEVIIANKELVFQDDEKEKRAAELAIANKELAFQDDEKEKRAAELVIANKELAFQDDEKEKRAAELIIANKELVFQNDEKEKRAVELIIANKELVFQNDEKEKRAAELGIANKELVFQNGEKEKRAAELGIANKELAFQNDEKEKRAKEKEKRAEELIVANKELAFQNGEKEKRAAELGIANKELAFQNDEKEKRAEELIIANKELAFQNDEKEKRAEELIVANKELAFQNEEKEKRAAELGIANKELAFQNEEKEKRAAELGIANNELAFQNDEKEKRAEELIVANKELAFQNGEKEKRAAELGIANKELAFQNDEKEKRAAELGIANKELAFQNEEKEKRAAELGIANKELAFQNDEKEKRAAELINANRLYAFISAINQTIVHSENAQTVFEEACRIAIDIGKFELALISIPDAVNKKLKVVEHKNARAGDLEFFGDLIYDDDGPTEGVFRSGKLHIINDYENEPSISGTRKFAAHRGFRSCILLPLKKSGKTIGVYNLYSTSANLFDQGEIALLEEAAGDISFALDVFEKEAHRNEMEYKVMHNELRLKQAQSIAHYGNWELDYSTGSGVWSDEACRIYGIDPDDNVQSYQSWLSFIHPGDLEYVMRVTKEDQEKLSNTAFHHRIIRKDGAVRHIFSQAHFEFNKQGMPVGLYSVVHDVTETKKAEEALAQSEANLRQIMDLIPQSISAKDYTGKYVFINNSFAALYGLTPNELINRSATETIPVTSESEYFLKQDQEVILSGKTKTIPEDIFVDHNGDTRLFYTVKVPFTVAGTNEKAVLGVTMDITEQKQAETERTKMIADIVQRNKNLEQFSYIISHNLRAPVANILGITNIVQTITLDKEEEKKMTGYLATAAKNLDNVIRDINHILELKHEVSEKKECVKFSELLNEIKFSIDNIINEEQVQIISDFSEADEILTIKSYLYSIFINLITNSIKYRQHGIAPVISITSARLKNIIRLRFKDNGLGIDLKRKGGEVFGLYKRFHDHVEGKGMGLYMVKTQVETLGGTITIASEVNKGTMFTLEFEINE